MGPLRPKEPWAREGRKAHGPRGAGLQKDSKGGDSGAPSHFWGTKEFSPGSSELHLYLLRSLIGTRGFLEAGGQAGALRMPSMLSSIPKTPTSSSGDKERRAPPHQRLPAGDHLPPSALSTQSDLPLLHFFLQGKVAKRPWNTYK